jgi:DNA-binding transcriptional regulator YdaS (Cro superfamily)
MDISAHERKALATKLGINEQYLYQALTGRRVPSAELCADIERATQGDVMRWDLRPDDWRGIWPELAERADAPKEVSSGC